MTRLANIIRSLSVIILIILFLLPLAGHVTTPDKALSPLENRVLQTRPTWTGNWTESRKKFDAYLNDQFGYRSFGIKTDNRLRLAFDGEQLLVVLGQNNWLFLSEPVVWNSYKGVNYTTDTVDQWLENLADLKTSIEEGGAQFYAMIPPNKARIYPEHAPKRYGSPGKHFLADLLAEPQASDLNLLDVMTPILRTKNTAPVYFRTDTHWTMLGAYQAYETLVTHLNENGHDLPMLQQEKLSPRTSRDRNGDLYTFLDKRDFERETTQIYIPPPVTGFGPVKFEENDNVSVGHRTRIVEKKSPTSTIVIIGDSFSDRLIPLFKHSFDKIVIVHPQEGAFTIDEVLEYGPDIVLFVPVERFGEKLSIFPATVPSP